MGIRPPLCQREAKMPDKKGEHRAAAPDRSQDSLPGRHVATFFLSVTNRCNLACDYCSAAAGPHNGAMLDPARAEDLVRQWIPGAIGNRLTLVFTGGEPLLWGYDNLGRICHAARDEASAVRKDLAIGIQSNGLLVDEDFIGFCRKYEIEPSFSLDGPPAINNIHRDGGERVVASLKMLRARQIDFAIVSCLTHELAAGIEPALEWFREQGFLKVRINSLGQPPPERAAISQPDPRSLFYVKKSIFGHMERHGAAAVQERNVLRQVRKFDALLEGLPVAMEHCELLQCGAGRNLVCLNPDGSLGVCVEKSMSDGPGRAHSLGELAGAREGLLRRTQTWETCQNCPADIICDHGCAVYHRMDHDGFAAECLANRLFWKYLVLKRAPALTASEGT